MSEPDTTVVRAAAFEDEDVARSYAFRPPYAPAMYDFLRGLVPHRRRLVDLGCGPGKIASALAGDFDDVLGIDPSPAMIAVAREVCPHPNVRWFDGRAEDADLGGAIDLVTAGTSIHWMAHGVLFPRLAARAAIVAVVSGDDPPEPPWKAQWRAAMARWLQRLHGVTYDETAFATDGRRYERWLDIAGKRDFVFSFRQTVEDFIACQHSRASWSRARMGAAAAAEFDADLDALLRPHAQDGMLEFELTTELVWGAPRATPR